MLDQRRDGATDAWEETASWEFNKDCDAEIFLGYYWLRAQDLNFLCDSASAAAHRAAESPSPATLLSPTKARALLALVGPDARPAGPHAGTASCCRYHARPRPGLPLPPGPRTRGPALVIQSRHSPTVRRSSSAASISPPKAARHRRSPLARNKGCCASSLRALSSPNANLKTAKLPALRRAAERRLRAPDAATASSPTVAAARRSLSPSAFPRREMPSTGS